jgi:hypothetical protein
MDIWNDDQTMMVLNGRHLLVDYSMNENSKIEKKLYYHWKHDRLMLKELVLSKLEDHKYRLFIICIKRLDTLVKDAWLLN